jgi:hypothetical protein
MDILGKCRIIFPTTCIYEMAIKIIPSNIFYQLHCPVANLKTNIFARLGSFDIKNKIP